MKPIANTITRQLFSSLGIVVLGILFISGLSIFFLLKTRTISKITSDIDTEHILICQLIRTDVEFLHFETNNTEYFRTGISDLLHQRDSIAVVINLNSQILGHQLAEKKFNTIDQFHIVSNSIERYNRLFALLINKLAQRGFKDYGLEGKMRFFAHRLESYSASIPLVELLALRRNEKDFLLRKEEKYIILFNQLADKVIKRLNPTDSSFIYLNSYREHFNELTNLENEIGLSQTEGLLGELKAESVNITKQLNSLVTTSKESADEVIARSSISFAIICFITVLVCVFIIYYTSTRLARPIKKLSLHMGKFMLTEGLNETELENTALTDEISNLSQSFIKLTRKLKAQFNEIHQKSRQLEKQNRELKKLNDELDRFIYSAAHDLKSPLSSLDGLVRLAEKEINTQEYHHYFDMMSDSINKLYEFIGDITDYAKNKRQNLKVEKIDIRKIVNDIVDSLKFIPQAANMNVDIDVHGGLLYTDRTRLEIILKNIISNSYHYTDLKKERQFLRILIHITDTQAKIKIHDNGIGIDENHLPKIFDMFYRAVEHSKGTGIGLFLVRESLKIMQGKISVKSVLGEWTAFTINIPNLKNIDPLTLPESDQVILEELV